MERLIFSRFDRLEIAEFSFPSTYLRCARALCPRSCVLDTMFSFMLRVQLPNNSDDTSLNKIYLIQVYLNTQFLCL